MIKLTAEASFDLDEKRKVWITLAGEVETAEEAVAMAPALAEAVTEQAAQAYAHAAARIPEITSKPGMTGFQET